MTTTADEEVPAAAPPEVAPTHPVGGITGVLGSEWIKLRSVRSTVWSLVAAIGMTIGLGALFCSAYVHRYDRLTLVERLTFDPTAHSLRGIYLAQLALGVLGVLVITSEFATGMIRNTFAATPQRSVVLGAKIAVFGVVALVVGMISAFGGFFVGQAILSSKHIEAAISDPGVLRSVLGAGAYLAGIGLLGLGLGALLRRTAGAIATLFGVVLVLPLLAQALPTPWDTDVSKVLPGPAGLAMIGIRRTGSSLSPGAGGLLFLAYIVAILALAFVALARRDA